METNEMRDFSRLGIERITSRDYQHSYDLSGISKVVFVDGEEEPFLILSRTLFHPQGGGQKSDRGAINSVPVLKVTQYNDSILHFVESVSGFFVGQEVEVSVEPSWRLICSRLHTAGHLIAGIIEEAYPELKAMAGHHWPGESRVEFDGNCQIPESEFLSDVNSRLAQSITNDLLVQAEPDNGQGRLVRVGTYASVPCGGTHVTTTSELDTVKIVSAKSKKGKFRVSYELAAHNNAAQG